MQCNPTPYHTMTFVDSNANDAAPLCQLREAVHPHEKLLGRQVEDAKLARSRPSLLGRQSSFACFVLSVAESVDRRLQAPWERAVCTPLFHKHLFLCFELHHLVSKFWEGAEGHKAGSDLREPFCKCR